MADNSNFYNYIVSLTNQFSCQYILTKDNQTIYNLIMDVHRKNIQKAASRGLRSAYLCIYETSAKYKGAIPIDAHIRPNDSMKTKLIEFKLESVLDRIRKKLYPFEVDVKILDETYLKIDQNTPGDAINSI